MDHFSQIDGPLSPRTVLLIDSQPIFRLGLQRLLAQEAGWNVIGQAPTTLLCVQLANELQPAFILLGLALREPMDTLRAIRQVTGSAIIVFLERMHEAACQEALSAGANACLSRQSTDAELLQSLSQLDHSAFPDMGRPMLSSAEAQSEAAHWHGRLTRQEQRILSQLATGKCNKLIGRELGIAEGTVKVHLKSMYKKMQCQGRTQAINRFLTSRPMVQERHQSLR